MKTRIIIERSVCVTCLYDEKPAKESFFGYSLFSVPLVWSVLQSCRIHTLNRPLPSSERTALVPSLLAIFHSVVAFLVQLTSVSLQVRDVGYPVTIASMSLEKKAASSFGVVLGSEKSQNGTFEPISNTPYKDPRSGVINERPGRLDVNPETTPDLTGTQALLIAAEYSNSYSNQMWNEQNVGIGGLNCGGYYRWNPLCEFGDTYSSPMYPMRDPYDRAVGLRSRPLQRCAEQRSSCALEGQCPVTDVKSTTAGTEKPFRPVHGFIQPCFVPDELRHQSYLRDQNLSSMDFALRFATQMQRTHAAESQQNSTPTETDGVTAFSISNQYPVSTQNSDSLQYTITAQPTVTNQYPVSVQPILSQPTMSAQNTLSNQYPLSLQSTRHFQSRFPSVHPEAVSSHRTLVLPGGVSSDCTLVPPEDVSSYQTDSLSNGFSQSTFDQLQREVLSNPSTFVEGYQTFNRRFLGENFFGGSDANLRKLSDICASSSPVAPPSSPPEHDTDDMYTRISVGLTAKSDRLNCNAKSRSGSCMLLREGDTPRCRVATEKIKFESGSRSRRSNENPLSCKMEEIDVTSNGDCKIKARVQILSQVTRQPKRRKSTGIRHCECPVCGKKLARASTLKIHMRQHTGDRPYKCTTCSKAFAQAGLLQSHNRVHSGERPFTCLFCPKKFSHSSALKTHLHTHTGERPHKCLFAGCGRAFADSSTLAKHGRTHTGEQPYLCDLCGKRFTQSGNMHKHKKSIHNLKNTSIGKKTTSFEKTEENIPVGGYFAASESFAAQNGNPSEKI